LPPRGLPNILFPSHLPTTTLSLHTPLLTHMCHLSQPSGCVFDHPNDIWWWVQIIKLLIMQSSPLSCYKSINHSVIHYVSQSVSQSVPIIYLNYLPLFEMGFSSNSVYSWPAARGTEVWCQEFHCVVLPEQMLIKTNISGTSHYSQSSTRWCFPGCDIMWLGRWLGTIPVCHYLCPRSLMMTFTWDLTEHLA
jgi:hypothetical protein